MSAAPSAVPSVEPSMSPVSSIPSALPTITGAVVFLELTQTVSASLTDDEIAALVRTAEESFGLYPENVTPEVAYTISGSLVIDFDEDYDEQELVETLQNSLATSLGVHSSDVLVTVNPETGEITYEIVSETAELAADLQAQLLDSQMSDVIAATVATQVPGATLVSNRFVLLSCKVRVEPAFGVEATVSLVVDATNTDNIEESITAFESTVSDAWGVSSECKLFVNWLHLFC